MENDLTQESIGWIAFAFNCYFLLYPAIPFINVLKGKLSFEESPGSYATINYLNCLCWYLYSDLLYSDQIKEINLIGVISNGIFIIIYLSYEIKKYTMDAILNVLILGSGTYFIYLSLTIMIEDDTIIGKICAGTYCLLFYFPIQIVFRVIKQKNFLLIPFCTAWGSVFMSISWILYGIMITEIYVVIPHCLNIIFQTVQIVLFLNYRQKYPLIDKNFNKAIIIENNEDNKKEESKIKDVEDNEKNIKERPVKILEKVNN